MFIKFHINREFFYFLLFIPISFIDKGMFMYLSKFQFILDVINSFSMCSLIIFYFYQIFTSKENNTKYKIILSKKNIYNIILLITCCILFNFNNLWLLNLNQKNKQFKEFYYAGVFLLIDSIFFKKNIFSHHILSNMIMIIIFLIIYFFYSYHFFNSLIFFFSIIL